MTRLFGEARTMAATSSAADEHVLHVVEDQDDRASVRNDSKASDAVRSGPSKIPIAVRDRPHAPGRGRRWRRGSTNHAPSGNRPASLGRPRSTRLVLPMPPGPVRVTSRASSSERDEIGDVVRSRPTNVVIRSGRLPAVRPSRSQRRELGRQSGDVELAQSFGAGNVLEHVATRDRARVVPTGSASATRAARRLGQDDLAAVSDGRRPEPPG